MQTIFTKLFNFARQIEQETYQAWALQRIAEAHIRLHLFDEVLKILKAIAPIREVKLQILEMYVREVGKLADKRRLDFMRYLPRRDSLSLSRQLAEGLSERQDLDGLFQILAELPGDFHLTCLLSLYILKTGFAEHGPECFQKWFVKIAPHWSITEVKN